MKKVIYLDNSATTPVSPKVLEAMLPYFKDGYGNPSSVYSVGREARIAVEAAREKVAKAINAKPEEIFFTSCGTESDNWALKGAVETLAKKGKKHIITTNFEHHAILHTCNTLEKQGFEVTYLKVDNNGMITAKQVKDAIRDDTAIVSIMYANNEIGSILPIGEIGAVCREKGVWFHTDAVQAMGNVEIDVVEQNIDMLSLTGHKIHAPKGIGALYIRKGISIPNFIDGGAQEKRHRAGTENVPYIVGFGVAMEEASKNLVANVEHRKMLRDRLIESLLKIPHTRLNGHREKRLCTNVNISFEGIEGESMLLMLDMKGICASSGSACTSGSLDPSHVLLAIGLPHEIAHGSLRLSVGEQNTIEEIDYVLEELPKIIERLRAMSPVWDKIILEENK
ncbi:MAG: cysteine desulfurase NifS [Oscillospiraceae bacterium]